jgi:ubiquinone/menaquinone biosynthesis C-methylase UbiE
LWRAIGRQFRRPEGWGGRLMGRVMEAINRAPNREVIAALEIAPADVVVEIGYGPGCAIEAIAGAAPQGRIYGVDPSAEMLAAASRRNRRALAAGRLSLTQDHICDLRLEPLSVDKILAVNVVYFFDQDSRELKEAWRLLKRGGRIALYATDKSVMKRWKFAGAETHRLYGRDELLALLRRAGFGPGEIAVREVRVAFGVLGLVATAIKR